MKLTIERIRKEAGNDIYRRGDKYYADKRVNLINIDLDRFDAEVSGTMPYRVSVQEIGQNLYSSCSCPYWTTCKHVVASLLEAKDWYDEHASELKFARTHPPWKRFFEKIINVSPEAVSQKRAVQQWRVIYLLELNNESWSVTPQKAYLKQNGFLGRFSNIGEFDLSSNELLHAPNDPIVVSHIQKIDQQNNSFYNNRYFGRSAIGEVHVYHYRYGSRLGPLFDLLRESIIFKKPYDDQINPLEFAKEAAQINFRFNKSKDGFRLLPFITFRDKESRIDASFKVLTESPIWLLQGETIIKVDNLQDASLLVPFTRGDITLSIPSEEFPEFLESVYPQLSESTPLPLPKSISVAQTDTFTKKLIFLKEGERHLELSLKFDYGQLEIDYLDPQKTFYKKNGKAVVHILRCQDEEEAAWNRLVLSGLKDDPKNGLRIIDSKALKWLFTNMPALSAEGFEFRGREDLKKYKVRTGKPNVHVAVQSNIDWFDVNIEIDIEGVALPIKELKRAIKQNIQYVKLADKSIAQLPDEWFDKFKHMFNFVEVEDDIVKASKFHATLIDILFEKAQSYETDDGFKRGLKKLRDFEKVGKTRLPNGLKGTLRPYQKAGYDWLYFLQEYGFGGALADDMGLGKTVQTLALLLREKQKGAQSPSLIVCPTSVVFNWEAEVQKFTPDLKVHEHIGMQRAKNTDQFNDYDIILTSYGIMRRDAPVFKDFKFHYVILDESQKIKNPSSQTAKAARLLKADFRLVLTGTPVENNTIELWSQFSFLNPGLLGSLYYFKRAFTYPIEKRGEEESVQFLRQLIFPFILRRTKEDVAKELPPKVEQTFYCAMNPEQERLYAYWRDYYRSMILTKIDQVGFDRARMNVLEGLVKLRQIACHSSLVDKSIEEDSGKFESLKELVEEIIAENHKVLIFSQFVKMLRVMRDYLDKNSIRYEYLDGHTTNRKENVDRFQNDPEIKLFLISLKAGGVGLNLTAADYVIHYDPWWNPAVEVQATDRAHRIGQTKKVFVYRLITKGSVEEKMLELQSRKKRLVSDLISTDSSFFKSLTRDDIDVLFG
jgi:non-specific serine/threonine protein kinase